MVAEVAAPDGKKSLPFGETPKGILIFTADGRFAQLHVAGDVPKIASKSSDPLLPNRGKSKYGRENFIAVTTVHL